MKILICFFPVWLMLAILFTFDNRQSTATLAIIDTGVCEIAATPEKYDGKVVRVSAYVSSGFEDSGLHDAGCAEEALANVMKPSTTAEPEIWMEFQDQGERYGVTGFALPVNDDTFQKFRKILFERSRLGQMTHATIVGTFYSSRPRGFAGAIEPMRGFGHMGCCALFVLSQVESVQTAYPADLDFSWAASEGMPGDCYSEQEISVPTNAEARQWQREAVTGRGAWRHDPRQTAEEQLERMRAAGPASRGGRTSLLNPTKEKLKPSGDVRPTETLVELSATPFKVNYEYIEVNRARRFEIVVSRPYWLEPVAGSAENVIWVSVASSIDRCVTQKAASKKD